MKVRIGIDVGGTFTKAVAIDAESLRIIGKATTLTTHYAPEGVARGVIQVFEKCLKELQIAPEDVTYIAHSTTQATNALLEGDVVPVGIVGIAGGIEKFLAKIETDIKDIELSPGRFLKTYHAFMSSSDVKNERKRIDVLKELIAKGAKAIVASEAYGVDDPTNELLIAESAYKLGVPAIGAHEISKLYGLTVRTRTAVINASILPKMIETANMTEESVRKAGIKAPLMIMRGDGGVMSIDDMRKRPILTALSGPAASVAGALMYLRVTDGIFFEVGGTSTNIGVIRNGRPMYKYVQIGGHRTYIHSLDVRVIGIAVGSMVRVKGDKIIDVGPRSAHIAGLPYPAFSKTEEIVDPKLIQIQPKPGDPPDYVAVETRDGKRFAITTTDAANVLGIAKPGDYAYGNPEASRRAMEPLAKKLGLTVEETAEKILEIASAKQIKVIEELMKEYNLEKEHTALVGGGGGAAALIPYTAKMMGMEYMISDNAEVISSIGVALALLCDSVERIIPFPKDEDIIRVRREAQEAVIKMGALPETVQVYIEIDPYSHRVRATAYGALEFMAHDLSRKASPEELKLIAAKSMGVPPEKVELLASVGRLNVFGTQVREKYAGFLWKTRQRLRVIDDKGVIRLNVKDGLVKKTNVEKAIPELKKLVEDNMKVTESGRMLPDVFVLIGSRIVDLSGLATVDQITSIASVELRGLSSETPVILLISK